MDFVKLYFLLYKEVLYVYIILLFKILNKKDFLKSKLIFLIFYLKNLEFLIYFIEIF